MYGTMTLCESAENETIQYSSKRRREYDGGAHFVIGDVWVGTQRRQLQHRLPLTCPTSSPDRRIAVMVSLVDVGPHIHQGPKQSSAAVGSGMMK